MRISAFGDEISPQFDEQVRVLRRLGVRGLELRGLDGTNIADLAPAMAESYAERLRQNGLFVSALGSPIGKIGVEDPFEPHLAAFRNLLDLSEIFDTPRIRIFSFYIPRGDDPARHRDEVLRRMEALFEAAAGYEVLLCHENERFIYGESPDRCLDLLETFGGALRAVFDPANFVQAGYRPYPDPWLRIAPYVEYLHIKDARMSDGGNVPAGEGDGGLPDILREALAQEPEMVLTLEPHLAVRPFSAGDDPVPGAYPDPETAFRAALDALTALLPRRRGPGGS